MKNYILNIYNKDFGLSSRTGSLGFSTYALAWGCILDSYLKYVLKYSTCLSSVE